MKENHGIRHIEWNISLQWMKRQKKYCLMVVWVAILACMLMQTGFLITDGISSAVMNQRKNIYGEWEYGLVNMDADSQTLIEDHPFIESKGKIQIYACWLALIWTISKRISERWIRLRGISDICRC